MPETSVNQPGIFQLCRDGLIRAFYQFRSAPLPERLRTDATADAEVLFWPLRSVIIGLISIIPLLVAFYSPRLDNFYSALLMSFFYWLILEKLTHMRRPVGFSRTCDALNDPGEAAEVFTRPAYQPPSAGTTAKLVLLFAGKIIALYVFCAKHLLAVVSQSTDTAVAARTFYIQYLRLNDNHIILLLLLVSLPVFSEAGAVLLYCGDAPDRQHKSPLLLLPGLLTAGAFGALIVIIAGPNVIIMPTALVIMMVFYWKKQADHHLGGLNGSIIDAYRETAELAIVSGLVLLA